MLCPILPDRNKYEGIKSSRSDPLFLFWDMLIGDFDVGDKGFYEFIVYLKLGLIAIALEWTIDGELDHVIRIGRDNTVGR